MSRPRVADDFAAIRARQRELGEEELLERCWCPKNEDGSRTSEVNDHCPVHGKSLEQLADRNRK